MSVLMNMNSILFRYDWIINININLSFISALRSYEYIQAEISCSLFENFNILPTHLYNRITKLLNNIAEVGSRK